MKIKAFKGRDKEELSMIEVARGILEEHGDIMDFSDLVNQIQQYLGTADKDIREVVAQFYTDLNIDGGFISLGDNRWGLRSWYPIDSIDEEVSHLDEEEEEGQPRRKKRKKINAFLDSDDEDGIDYNDDDPEDDDLEEEYVADEEEISEYDKDLSEIGADDLAEDDDLEAVDEDDVDFVVDEDDED